MIISLIVATSSNHAIGKDNKLLWHLSEDLKKFKEITLGHTLIMGRKTFESIGRPLPGRSTLVVSRSTFSIEEAILRAKNSGETECFICGGGEVYKYALEHELVNRIYLTTLNIEVEGDTYFVKLNPLHWVRKNLELHYKGEKNFCDWVFQVLEHHHFTKERTSCHF